MFSRFTYTSYTELRADLQTPNPMSRADAHVYLPVWGVARILAATWLGFFKSCSQSRSARQFCFFRTVSTCRSRVLFRESFVRQYCLLVAGISPCFGQPCQKQPS